MFNVLCLISHVLKHLRPDAKAKAKAKGKAQKAIGDESQTTKGYQVDDALNKAKRASKRASLLNKWRGRVLSESNACALTLAVYSQKSRTIQDTLREWEQPSLQ